MPAPDPGWYDDPTHAGRLRRWDGGTWTDQTRPLTPAPEASPEPRQAEETIDIPAPLPAGWGHEPRRDDRRRKVAIGLGAAVLGLGVIAALTSRQPNVHNLKIGDCFDEGSDFESEVVQVSNIPIVDCVNAHDAEVYAVFDLRAASFPGQQTINDEALVSCVDLFEDRVGFPLPLTSLDVAGIWPSEASWAQGDRSVACYLSAIDGSALAGTRLGLAPPGGSVVSLSVGDCFNSALVQESIATTITGVQTVPCSREHYGEVYAQFDLPEGPYPGFENVLTSANEGCYDAFEPFVGQLWETSSLFFNMLTPTRISWASGDHGVQCFVFHPERPMVGSAPQWVQTPQGAAAVAQHEVPGDLEGSMHRGLF
ncbi:MAG: hypothetical protein ACI867_001631 [Glaciecola sp.]|jgi:hypothetical protein